MTKKELILVMKRKTFLHETQVRFIVDEIFDTIIKEIKKGESVKIHGFGKFRPSLYKHKRSMRLVPARMVREYLNF